MQYTVCIKPFFKSYDIPDHCLFMIIIIIIRYNTVKKICRGKINYNIKRF